LGAWAGLAQFGRGSSYQTAIDGDCTGSVSIKRFDEGGTTLVYLRIALPFD